VSKARLETISDAVIAILITIMVLQLRPPAGSSWHALRGVVPVFLAYVLSFANLAIYWNNHHHMIATVHRINGAALWANLHLLFWLSLIPFTTAWMSTNHFRSAPTAAYGIVLLAAAIAYLVVQRVLLRLEGRQSVLAASVGRDLKGRASLVLHCLGIGLSFVSGWLGLTVYVALALMWLVPDPRVERRLAPARAGTGDHSR
jgi:uncharacterized membrane protein